jgi:two-component system cell cycle sensor histidine kinase/response regulator CckA
MASPFFRSLPEFFSPSPTGKGAALETILIVDDDQMVLSATRELLELSGYEVLSAETGSEALALVQEPETEVDLILLDLSLPDMGGLNLLPQLTSLRPGLKVVVCTGSFEGNPLKLGRHPSIKSVLQKPFNLTTLQKTVRDALAA